MKCESCDSCCINGVFCHETGCPDSHVGTTRECDWCGCEFEPETKHQSCCCEDCAVAYQC
jgi:hypothetical protein